MYEVNKSKDSKQLTQSTEPDSVNVMVSIGNDQKILVQATPLSAESDKYIQAVASTDPFNNLNFDDISLVIKEIANSLFKALEQISPHKVGIEFGIEIGIEPGQLTAMLVKGSATASLKITLEWDSSLSK